MYPLELKLDGRLPANGDSEIAKIIPFAYQTLPSTKQQSSEFFKHLFQIIYSLSRNLVGGIRQHEEWDKINKYISLAYQRLPNTKQPSSEFFKHRLPNNISSGAEISLETADR